MVTPPRRVPSITRMTVRCPAPASAVMSPYSAALAAQNTSGRSAWRQGSRSTAKRSSSVGGRPSTAQVTARPKALPPHT